MHHSKSNNLILRDKLESLLHGIARLNADVSEVKDTVKGLEIETTKQNERISTFEETFSDYIFQFFLLLNIIT